MKLIITILFLYNATANCTIYYVSNAGSDLANGTSTGTSWQTCAKVNAETFVVGDQILFNRGDIWNEKIIPPSSGSEDNSITFGAYGIGEKPIITGFQSITLSDQGGNIWSATATSSVKSQNTIMINGALRAKGRYPNYSFLVSISVTSTQIITDLSGTPNYTGAQAVVRDAMWILDAVRITSQSGGTLNIGAGITYPSGANFDYFLQNFPSLLDTLNEWCIDSTTKLLSVFASSSPTVQYSNIDTLITIHKKEYITFDGLTIAGSNMYGALIDSSNHITFQNCTISNHGYFGIYGLYINTLNVINDTIQNCLSNGSYTDADTSVNYTNNYIKNIGIYEGMGGNGNGKYIGLNNVGHYHNYANNQIFNCGYMGIYWKGGNGLIENNYVDSFSYIKQDGGGIYTFQSGLAYNYDSGTVIKNNIITNGIGIGYGYTPEAYGIYLDVEAFGIHVDSNTISRTASSGIFANGSHNIFTNNTVNSVSGRGCFFSGETFNGTSFFMTVKHNIFYSAGVNANFNTFKFVGARDTTESIDSNYYLMPFSPNNTFNNGGLFGEHYNLSQWQDYTGNDMHSSATLPIDYSSNVPIMLFNSTSSDSTFLLGGNYRDVYNTFYTGSTIIQPFKSKLLFPVTVILTGVTGRIGNLNFQ